MGKWIVQYPTYSDDGISISEVPQKETALSSRDTAEWYFETLFRRIHPNTGVWTLLYRSTKDVYAGGETVIMVGTEEDTAVPGIYAQFRGQVFVKMKEPWNGTD